MLTKEEIIASFKEIDARVAAAKAKPAPKPAQVKFDERCAEKPTEAVIRDAAIHNEAATQRLRQERIRERQQAELAEASTERARYQAVLDRHWQSMLDAQREQRAFRMVGGFWEGPNPGDYNPIERYEREWRR
jgi:hypothetical protein